MSTVTPNINLTKPSTLEQYALSVVNGNSDIIDTEVDALKKGKPGGGQPFGHMGMTATTQTIASTATVVMDAAQVLQGGMTFDNGNDALVIPKAGWYIVRCRGYANAGTAPYRAFFTPRKVSGNVDLLGARVSVYKAVNTNDFMQFAESTYQFAAGDKVKIFADFSGATDGKAYGSDGYDGVFLEIEYRRDV